MKAKDVILNAEIIILIGLFKYGKITAKFASTVKKTNNDNDRDNNGLFTSHHIRTERTSERRKAKKVGEKDTLFARES